MIFNKQQKLADHTRTRAHRADYLINDRSANTLLT